MKNFFNARSYSLMSILAGQEGNARVSAEDKANQYVNYAVSVFSKHVKPEYAKPLVDILVCFSTKVVELHNANRTNPDFKLEPKHPFLTVYFPSGIIVPQMFLVSMLHFLYRKMYLEESNKGGTCTAYNGVGFAANRNRKSFNNAAFQQLGSFFNILIERNKSPTVPLSDFWLESALFSDLSQLLTSPSSDNISVESKMVDAKNKEITLGINNYDRLAVYSTFDHFLQLTPLGMLYAYVDLIGYSDGDLDYFKISNLYESVSELNVEEDKRKANFENYAKTVYGYLAPFYKGKSFKFEGNLLDNFTQPMLKLLSYFYDIGLIAPSSSDSILGQDVGYFEIDNHKSTNNNVVLLELDFLYEGSPHYFKIWAGQMLDGSIVHYVSDSYDPGLGDHIYRSGKDLYVTAKCEVIDPNKLIRTVLRSIRNATLVRGKLETILLKSQSSEAETDMIKLLKVLRDHDLLRTKSVEMQMFY